MLALAGTVSEHVPAPMSRQLPMHGGQRRPLPHIPPVQHPAFNAEQNFALNPSVEGGEQGRERGRLRLLRFLYPLDAALKGADDGRGF